MEKTRIFADGMESVSLTEGMIRMELYAVPAVIKQDEKAQHEIFTEIIMPPQGFIRAYSAMNNLVEQLTKAGIVKRNNNTEAPADAAEKPASVSPNFN